MVRNLFNNQGAWDVTELKKFSLPYEIEAISKIHLNGIEKEDKRFWILEKKRDTTQ